MATAETRPDYGAAFQPQREWHDKWNGAAMTRRQAQKEAFYAHEMCRAAMEGRLSEFIDQPQSRNAT